MSVIRKCFYILFVVLVGSSFGYPQLANGSSEPGPAAARRGAHARTISQKSIRVSPKSARVKSAEKLQLINVGVGSPKAFPESLPLAGEAGALNAPWGSTEAHAGSAGAARGVSEFQAVSSNFDESGGALVAPASDSRKSALRNIHGEVDGALAPGRFGASQIGGAVGATSKSGKTSVFLQTNRSNVQEPR
jgi:hypothetical protein